MGNEDVIEFNGKRYDAFTGKVLGKSRSEVVEPLAPARIPRTIDGVVRKKHAASAHDAHLKHTSKPRKASPDRHASAQLKPHRPQSAKTLMRRAVHKPATTIKPNIKPQAPAEIIAKPISAVAVKHSVKHVSPEREQRAKHTAKSQSVKRFTDAAHHHTEPIFQPAQVPTPAHIIRPQTNHHTNPDIFEAAIARANSHEQPPVKPHNPKQRRRKKITGVLVGVTALLAASGFLAYINMSTIELKVASFQAGFNAQLPSHQPTGYELTSIQNRPGQVTLDYHSGDRKYQISQQPTDWNSQTLGDHIIAGADSNTIQSKGRTIYIYDDLASWVSGGVRYDITGNAGLDKDEIAAIAGSM